MPKQMHRDDPQQVSVDISIALVAFKNQIQGSKIDAQYLYVVLGKPSCRPK